MLVDPNTFGMLSSPPYIFVGKPFYINKTHDSCGAWWSDLGRSKLTIQPMTINSLY